MKKEQEDLCLVAYDLEKVAPTPRVYNWTKERLDTREFESAIGLGWHIRAKHKFMKWMRKALKADYDIHDVIQGYGEYRGERGYSQTIKDFKGKGL